MENGKRIIASEINLNAVVKLALNEENKEFENSIITVFALSDRRVSNKIKKLIRIKWNLTLAKWKGINYIDVRIERLCCYHPCESMNGNAGTNTTAVPYKLQFKHP